MCFSSTSFHEKCQFVELMMLLTTLLRTALGYVAVQTFPVLLSRRTSLQKTSVSGRSMSTLLLGPESDSGDKSNNYNWRHFLKFNKNSWIRYLLKNRIHIPNAITVLTRCEKALGWAALISWRNSLPRNLLGNCALSTVWN